MWCVACVASRVVSMHIVHVIMISMITCLCISQRTAAQSEEPVPIQCSAETIDTEGVILAAARNVFSTKDGAYLSALSADITETLIHQMHKVSGLDPAQPFNMSTIRQLPALTLVQLLLLASVGNFTTGKSTHWQQPCRVVIDSASGVFSVDDERSMTDEILSVLIVILCIVQLKQIMESL